MPPENRCSICGSRLVEPGQECPFCAEARKLVQQLASQEPVRLCARCGVLLGSADGDFCPQCSLTVARRPFRLPEDGVAGWIYGLVDEHAAEAEGFLCPHCGQPTSPSAIICSHCGKKIDVQPTEFEHLLEQICYQLLDGLQVTGCTLSQWDRAQGQVTNWITYARHPNLERPLQIEAGQRFPVEQFPSVARVLQQRVAVPVRTDDPEAEPADRALLEERGQQAALLLPLVAGDEVIGLLEVFQWDQPRSFTPQEIALAQTLADQAALVVEGSHLFEEARREARELAALLEASSAILSSLRLETVLHTVAEQMARIVGVEGCTFSRWDEATRSVHTWVTFGPESTDGQPSNPPRSTYRLEDHPLMARVLDERTPAVIQADDTEADPAELERLDQVGLRSLLMLPVVAYDRVVALAELVESRRRHEFSQREIGLAQALANQAAVAVENAHLLRERERRITELGILNQIGRTFSSDLDLEALLETMYEQVSRLFGTDNFLVALYDEGSHEWNMALHAQRGKRLASSRHEVSEGLTGYILRNCRPVLLRNLEENLAFHEEHEIAFVGERAKTWMGVPLIVADRVVGTMAIQNYEEENRWGNQDMVVLSTIAAQAAIAVVNARLYSQVQQQLKNLREAYDEVQRAQDQLIQAQKMEAVGLLAAGLAHDFNNLLTIISLYTDQALNQLIPTSPLYPDLEEVRQAVLRATGLIRQLLLFSRQQPIEPRTLNLGSLVAGLLKILRRLLREDVTLTLDLPEDLWTVHADPGAVEQILINLVMNARDAIPREGSIHLVASNVQIDEGAIPGPASARPGSYVCLSVEDSGIGMDQETVERIFEPFFTTKALGKGTGLGLAVVQQIVERHRGWIGVDSAPGRGTRFSIYLPRAAELEEAAGPSSDAPPARGHGERILLVEDSTPLRAVLQDALSEAGYTVLAAANGEEALALFVQAGGGVNLILSDVILPDDRGYLLADELTSGQPHLPVLLISGYLEDQDEWLRIRERGYPFLPKPFNIEQLLHLVHGLLEISPKEGEDS